MVDHTTSATANANTDLISDKKALALALATAATSSCGADQLPVRSTGPQSQQRKRRIIEPGEDRSTPSCDPTVEHPTHQARRIEIWQRGAIATTAYMRGREREKRTWPVGLGNGPRAPPPTPGGRRRNRRRGCGGAPRRRPRPSAASRPRRRQRRRVAAAARRRGCRRTRRP